jgi:hypothetical protein
MTSLLTAVFDSHPLPPPLVDGGNDNDRSNKPLLDARLVGMMMTALHAGVSKFNCPASPLPLSTANASGGCWDANQMSEQPIVSTLNHALEMMHDLSRLDEDGGRCNDSVMTLTNRLGY